MINDITEILFVVNFIIFCCICIPYEFLWIIRPRKGRIVTGIVNAFIYSIIFTVLVVYIWYVAVIIWLFLGFWLVSKVQNSGKKKFVACVVIVVAILLAVIGIGNSNESKENSKQSSDKSYEESNDDAEDYDDTEFLVEESDYLYQKENTEDADEWKMEVDTSRAHIMEFVYYEAFSDYSLTLIFEGDECKEYELHMSEYDETTDQEYVTDSKGTVEEDAGHLSGILTDDETGQQWNYQMEYPEDHYVVYVTDGDGTDLELHDKTWADENAG